MAKLLKVYVAGCVGVMALSAAFVAFDLCQWLGADTLAALRQSVKRRFG
jgi:hypothetical protein